MKKNTKTTIIATTTSLLCVAFSKAACFLIIFLCIVALFSMLLVLIVGVPITLDAKINYFEGLDNQENSVNFFYLNNGDYDATINNNWINFPSLNTPVNQFDCNYFGATHKELFYYIETYEGIEFYKSNYTDCTYEMTRSFNYDEILYHKCDKLIYLGKDGETYIFDGFDLTNEVYEGEIPTYMPRYTVTAEKKDFVIKDNETGEEKRISDLKKTFRQNEHVKKLGWYKSIDYVFVHDDNIYIVYTVVGLPVTFELDFERQTLTLVNWGETSSLNRSGAVWYLDRVKFEE